MDDALFLEDLMVLLDCDNSFTEKLDTVMGLLIKEGLVPNSNGNIQFLSG